MHCPQHGTGQFQRAGHHRAVRYRPGRDGQCRDAVFVERCVRVDGEGAGFGERVEDGWAGGFLEMQFAVMKV